MIQMLSKPMKKEVDEIKAKIGNFPSDLNLEISYDGDNKALSISWNSKYLLLHLFITSSTIPYIISFANSLANQPFGYVIESIDSGSPSIAVEVISKDNVNNALEFSDVEDFDANNYTVDFCVATNLWYGSKDN